MDAAELQSLGWAVSVAAVPLSILVYRWLSGKRADSESVAAIVDKRLESVAAEQEKQLKRQDNEIADLREQLGKEREHSQAQDAQIADLRARVADCHAERAGMEAQIKWMKRVLKANGISWDDDPPPQAAVVFPQEPKA